MATEVEAVAWGWWCDECVAGGRYEHRGLAEREAERHDEENHKSTDSAE